MRQLSTRDQMTDILTTINHRTAFNNEHIPYHVVSHKRPRNYNLNEKSNGLIYVQKNERKTICNTSTNDNH